MASLDKQAARGHVNLPRGGRGELTARSLINGFNRELARPASQWDHLSCWLTEGAHFLQEAGSPTRSELARLIMIDCGAPSRNRAHLRLDNNNNKRLDKIIILSAPSGANSRL